MTGAIDYRLLLEAGRLTRLHALCLGGTASAVRSEFLYCAALRRLSALSALTRLSFEGATLFAGSYGSPAAAAAAAAAGGAAGGGRVGCAAAVAALLASGLPVLRALRLACSASTPSSSSSSPSSPSASGALRPCSWQAALLSPAAATLSRLTALELHEPGPLPEAAWADGLNALAGLRRLELRVATPGSAIVDDAALPALAGLTALRLEGLELDTLGLLAHASRGLQVYRGGGEVLTADCRLPTHIGGTAGAVASCVVQGGLCVRLHCSRSTTGGLMAADPHGKGPTEGQYGCTVFQCHAFNPAF